MMHLAIGEQDKCMLLPTQELEKMSDAYGIGRVFEAKCEMFSRQTLRINQDVWPDKVVLIATVSNLPPHLRDTTLYGGLT
jgi:hypothetical protein